jgi:hypothetical protein
MKRRIIPFISVLSAILCVISVGAWSFSYRSRMELSWTSGDEYNKLIADKGTGYFVQVHRWWRQEKVKLQTGLDHETSDVSSWPGMLLDSQRKFIGFVGANGLWKSPYIEVSPDTVRTNKNLEIRAGAMFSSTTRVDINGSPFWFVAGVFALLPTLRYVQKRRRKPINA